MTAYRTAGLRVDHASTWSAIHDHLTEVAAFAAAARRAEGLLMLGDAELARRGLRREDIVDRVFRSALDRRERPW